MHRLLPILALMLAACGPRVANFPGPPGVLGRPARPVPVPASIETPTVRAPAADPSWDSSRPVADAATHYLSHRPPSRFRDDCSGFVEAVLDRAGVPVSGNTASLWERASAAGAVHRRRRPAPGELVFFDNTYDRNGNGRLDDDLTHVGVVTTVDAYGTIEVVHVSSKGRGTLYMNLEHPADHADASGNVLNSFLRAATRRDSARTPHLAGELWRGFATVQGGDGGIWRR